MSKSIKNVGKKSKCRKASKNVFKNVLRKRSKNVRNESVRHEVAVLLPAVAVLGRALLLVPERAVEEQDAEEEDVQEGLGSI
jgi:hypothetical protein